MSTALATEPRTGIFAEPAADYHAHPAVSKGKLSTFRQRKRLYHGQYVLGMDFSKKPTADMEKGTLTHCGLLEPDRFESSYALYPDNILGSNGAVSTNAAKVFRDGHAAEGRIAIKECDLEDVLAMIESVKRKIGGWLKLESRREHSVYWPDDETNILCRCRPDWLILRSNTAFIFDLKTTNDASPDAFQKTAETHDYWLQHAHYSTGVHVGLDRAFDTEFHFVVVENQFPYATAIYQLLPSAALAAEKRRASLMQELAQCLATGDWAEPWERNIQPLDIRPWAFE